MGLTPRCEAFPAAFCFCCGFPKPQFLDMQMEVKPLGGSYELCAWNRAQRGALWT